MNIKIIVILIFQIFVCSITDADEHYLLRYQRAVGGESLDTSNFVLYVDPNGSRFIDVPKIYMNNWLDDQKMWRTWSIILAVLSVILFGTLLSFLIYGFCTSTGPFVYCTKDSLDDSSEDKLTSLATTIPFTSTSKTILPTSLQTQLLSSHQLARLQSTAQLYSK